MKKFWKIIFVLFLALLGLALAAVVAGVVLLKNLDISKYKPQIIQVAGQSLGRKVDFKDIGLQVSWEKGVRLHLTDFSVGDNPDFGTEDFLSVKEIEAGVGLVPSLTARQIVVPNILIRDPKIHVVRNAQGVFNVQTLGRTGQKAATSPSAAAGIPAVFINSFKIENAEIHFLDQTVEPVSRLSVTQMDFGVEHFSLINPFDVQAQAAVLSPQKNFQMAGKIQLDLAAKKVKINDLDISADLDNFSLQELSASPLFKNMPLPQVLEGQFASKIKQAVFSDKGLSDLLLDASLSKAQVVIKDISPGISLEASHLDFSVNNFSLDTGKPFQVRLTAALYQDETNVDFQGLMSLDLKTMDVHLTQAQVNTDFSLWPLEKIKALVVPLKTVPLPEKLSGKFQIQITELEVNKTGLETVLLDAELDQGEILMSKILPNGSSLDLIKTRFRIKDFSLDRPFSVWLETACFGKNPNITLEANVRYDLTGQKADVNDATLGLNLDDFSLPHVQESGLVPQGAFMPQTLGGKLSVRVKDFSPSSQTVNQVKADISWKDGKLEVPDAAPGISVALNSIDLELKNFGLDTPFGFDLALGYLNDEKNMKAQGTAALNTEEQSVVLKDASFDADLSALNLEKLKSSVAALKTVSLPERVQGQFHLDIMNASAGAKGLMSLNGRGELKQGSVKLKELNVPITGIDAGVQFTDKDFSMDTLHAGAGKGAVSAQVGIKDYLNGQDFDLTAEIKDLDLSEILDQSQAQVKVQGLVTGQLKARGQGKDLNSITGEGDLQIQQAKLKDLNVLKTVLDKISFLPNVASRVEENLPERYKEKLNNKDTDISKLSTGIVISQGILALEPALVQADEFMFSGKCLMEFDARYSLDGDFKIPAELSAAMAKGVAELEYLYDTEGNISLPIHVTGKGPERPTFAVTQTAIDMGKNAIRSEGKKQIKKALDKIFGAEESPAPDQGSPESPAPAQPSQEQQSSPSDVIGDIFDNIFK